MSNASADIQHAVFGYGRVSTTDQTTDNQRLELQAAGFAIPGVAPASPDISSRLIERVAAA